MIKDDFCLGYMPDGTGTAFPFDDVFKYSKNILKEGMEDVDAIVLWGGEDIAPSYYKEKRHSRNQSYTGHPSQRDKNEWKAMLYAKANGIPIIGVCRGAQFLCVFSGGKLIQHVDNHGRSHDINTSKGKTMVTSSCHHQMMFPYNTQHELLAWSTEPYSSIYEDENDLSIAGMKSLLEPEVVFFPQTRGLAIQGHPEWMDERSEFIKYCNALVREYLMVEECVL